MSQIWQERWIWQLQRVDQHSKPKRDNQMICIIGNLSRIKKSLKDLHG